MSENDYIWMPPRYDTSKVPKATCSFDLLPDKSFDDNFARMSKWSPDGTTFLAQCENRSFQRVDLDIEKYTIAHAHIFDQPAPILDFAWYPSATSRDPASFCFVASVRECPVKLLDASDGRLRASYRIVDHRERQIAPHSLAFNVTAQRLYCGFEDAIEVFDFAYPGEGTRLHTTPSKKARDGLKGVISALAFSPDLTSGIFAAGSLSPSSPSSSNIALFSESTGEVPVMYLGHENQANGRFGIRASVTQLAFNPAKPHLIYAAFRRHDPLYCWDLRGNPDIPIDTFCRHITADNTDAVPEWSGVQTNQKLRFDIDLGGQWLGIGDQNGAISIFDLNTSASTDNESTSHADEPHQNGPTLQFQSHEDAVGSVAFHPFSPILLSVSGSRHFEPDQSSSTSDSSSSDPSDSDGETDTAIGTLNRRRVKRPRHRIQPSPRDASLKLWDFTS